MSNHAIRRRNFELEQELGDVRVTSRLYHDKLKLAEATIKALNERWDAVWFRRLWRRLRR